MINIKAFDVKWLKLVLLELILYGQFWAKLIDGSCRSNDCMYKFILDIDIERTLLSQGYFK